MTPEMRMHNLTLASAKHLHAQGHITRPHYNEILRKVAKARAAPSFGSMQPQQAQAPIPGAPPAMATPPGTATGYSDDE